MIISSVGDEYGHARIRASLMGVCPCKVPPMPVRFERFLRRCGNGYYVLLYKRLGEKRFQWPRNEQELPL